MPEHRRVRIEIVIEEMGLATLTARLSDAGATGWTVLPAVQGSGRHGAREPDHVAGISANVILFVLAEPDEATVLASAATDVVRRFSGVVMSYAVTVHS